MSDIPWEIPDAADQVDETTTSSNASSIPVTERTPQSSLLSSSESDSVVAPLYITIGPPCGGKTGALRTVLENHGYDPEHVLSSHDVALDEQSNVYCRVPLAAFIYPATQLHPKLGAQVLSSGVTVQQRLLHPSPPPLDNTDEELRNIILRVAGRMTAEEFATRTREQAIQAGDTVKFFRKRRIQVAEDLIKAVEQVSVQAVSEVLFQREVQAEHVVMLDQETGQPAAEPQEELPYYEEQLQQQQQQQQLQDNEEPPKIINATAAHLLSARALIQTPHVDLFVPHAIFGGGISKAEERLGELLQQSPISQPVVWGNTNTRPMEYAAALLSATRTRRPVQFVAWGNRPTVMPRVPRPELLRRNVARFRRTGRYIPAGAVGAALARVERLVQEAEKEAAKLVLLDDDDDDDDNALANDNNTDRHRSEKDVIIERRENLKMNMAFASLAGFVMDKKGYVVKMGEPRNLNQKSFRGNNKNKKNHNNMGPKKHSPNVR